MDERRDGTPFIAALTGGPDDGTTRRSMSDEFGMLPALPPQDPTSRVPGQLSGIYWPTHERTPDASVLYRWREGGATPDWLQPDGADRQAGRRRTVRGWPNIDRTLGGPQADE